MADVQPMADRSRPPPRSTPHGDGSAQFLQRIRHHAPNSTQLLGILTLVVSVGVLFVLGCITATAATIGLILFSPIIVLSTPIWLPIGAVLFLLIASFLVLCSVAVASVGLGSWLYRYFKGLHPPGSDRVDYARSRIADTASHVKDYAREYGGYIQSKVKDAAPGA